MADVILIQPDYVNPVRANMISKVRTPPLGLAYLSAILIKHRIDVFCIDMMIEGFTLNRVKQIIRREKPKLVGITSMTENYKRGLVLANLCKSINKEIIVVMGGPHVTFTAEDTLQNEGVDIVVRGEGELTMLEIANFFLHNTGKLAEIKGIGYKDNGQIISNPMRPLVKNPDEFPFPARRLFPLEKYGRPAAVITSRGCPYRCIFCTAPRVGGGEYRNRSIKNIVSEIKYLTKQGYARIDFLDDTLTAHKKLLTTLCSEINRQEIAIRWGCEARANTVTKKLLKIMAGAGCVLLQYGVESASEKVLQEIRKDITIQQVLDAVKWAHELGIKVICTFMIGNPSDTEKTVRKSIDFAVHLKEEYGVTSYFSIMVPYPGSYVYEHSKDLEIEITSNDYDDYWVLNPVIQTKYLTGEKLKALQFESSYQLRKTIPRDLKDKTNYYESKLKT